MNVHSSLEQRAKKSNKAKVWFIILMTVVVFLILMVIFIAPSAKESQPDITSKQELTPIETQNENKNEGQELTGTLKTVFEEFKNLIGSKRTDVFGKDFTINNFYLIEKPEFT